MTRNILIATLFTLASAVALLAIFLTEKSVRIPHASAATAAVQLERGAMDFDQYCAACHGLAGQGFANETGAPPLNNIVQRYMTPGEDGNVAFDQKYGIKEKYGSIRNYVEATIISGVRNTPMPAWSQETGGPLRRDQIENITTYILSWNGQAPESAVTVAEQIAQGTRPTADPNASPLAAGQVVFTTGGCAGCHAADESKLLGPGLGGLFQPEGTRAYGTNLPNGKPVNEENVREWILKGTAGFAEHIDPVADGPFGPMPPMPVSEADMDKLIAYLKALKRDGTTVEGAEAPAPEGGTLQPTVVPTTQPGNANNPDTGATTPPMAPERPPIATPAP